MTSISRSALVPYSAGEMFSLVNDIESYPVFLPWCTKAQILEQDEDHIRATIELSKGGVHRSFTTVNRLQSNKMIEIRLLEGPFHHLEGFWRFEELEGGCKVSLDMDFEFSGRMVRFVVGPVFTQIAGSLVDAFVQRAHQVYGRSG